MADGSQHPAAVDQKIWQIIVIAFIAIAFTAVWLTAYEKLNIIIWMNDFVADNRWTIPAGVLLFSFLVGLCEKYLNAPNVITGGFAESMQGEGSHGDYKLFPGTLLSSFFSLFSGASVGPEGPLAFLVSEISAWIRRKLKVNRDSALGFDVAALASAYNGIIGSPLFTAVFATEFNVGKKDGLKFLAWNLIAGIIGFLFFYFVGLKSFANFLSFPAIKEITGIEVAYAIVLGVLGAFVAIMMGLAMKGIGAVMERTFKDRVMTRIMAAAVIIAIVCYLIPDLMFSGETQIHSIIGGAAQIGIVMLLLMAVLKASLLALSFKSGYLGGPIFPTMFTCTMIGLALSLAFPGTPTGILVLCLMVAVITLALGVPLTAILLVTVVGTADPNMIVLLVVSSAVALILGILLREIRAKRAGNGNINTKSEVETSV
ncbi:MAG TPA: chloride channel protein [Methanoregulaceae archaeon]|nr:chloride channel protein [Methanoregulaceae archaeon]